MAGLKFLEVSHTIRIAKININNIEEDPGKINPARAEIILGVSEAIPTIFIASVNLQSRYGLRFPRVNIKIIRVANRATIKFIEA